MIKVIATGDSLFCAEFPREYAKIRPALDAFLSDADVTLNTLSTSFSYSLTYIENINPWGVYNG